MVIADIFSRVSGRSILKSGMLFGALLGATYLGEYAFHRYSLQQVQTTSSECQKAVEDYLDQINHRAESFFVSTKSEWPTLFSRGVASSEFLEAATAMLPDEIQDIVCVDTSSKVTYSLRKTVTADFLQNPSIVQLIEQVAITLMPTIARTSLAIDSADRLFFMGFPYINNKSYRGTILVCVKPTGFEALVKKHAGQNTIITVAQAQGERGIVLFSSEADERQFVLPSRPLLQKIFKGEFGVSLDRVKNQWLYNARNFLVSPGWGMSVVLKHSYLPLVMLYLRYIVWGLLSLLVIFGAVLLLVRSRLLCTWLGQHATILVFIFLSSALLISVWLGCHYIRSYFSQKADIYKKNVAQAQYNVHYAAMLFLEHNHHLQSVMHGVVHDLNTGNLKLADWKTYSKKIIPTLSSTNYFGFGISYVSGTSASEDWTTSYVLKNNNVITAGSIEKLSFGADLKKMTTFGWIQRTAQQEFGPGLYYIYAEPFTQGHVKGFVWASFPYDYVTEMVKVVGKDRAANAIAFDLNGNLVYHPNFELIKNSISVKAAAPEILPAVAKAFQGDSGYLDLPGKNALYIYESMPNSLEVSSSRERGGLGVIYHKSEFSEITPEMHRCIALALFFFILALLYAIALLMSLYTFVMYRWFVFGGVYCGLTLLGVGSLIALNYNYLKDMYAARAITSSISVIKAKESREVVKNIKVVPIMTSLTIQFLDIAGPNEVTFSALVRQSIDRSKFPQASLGFRISNKVGPITIKEISRSRVGDQETVLYAAQGTVHQIRPNYAQAPFDVQRVSIVLTPVEQEDHVFLALDVDAYDRLAPASKPGLSSLFEVTRYVIEESYFTYQDKTQDLIFELVLKRNLLSILLESFLPLLVILITIFLLTLVSMFAQNKRVNMLSVISGLFFSLILLHQKYRSTLSISEVSFLEMFIVVVYASLAYAYLDVVYLMRKPGSKPYKALLYWPAIMTYLLVATLGIFG